MDLEKDRIALVATAGFAWTVTVAVAGIIFSVIESFNPAALREVLIAAVMFYPLKEFFPVETLAERSREFMEKKSRVLILSALHPLLFFLASQAGIDSFPMGYYGILHHSIISGFLKAELLYSGIFGESFADLLYMFSTLYLETMIVYAFMDPVNRKLEEVRDS
jgi:hypothetical protein